MGKRKEEKKRLMWYKVTNKRNVVTIICGIVTIYYDIITIQHDYYIY